MRAAAALACEGAASAGMLSWGAGLGLALVAGWLLTIFHGVIVFLAAFGNKVGQFVADFGIARTGGAVRRHSQWALCHFIAFGRGHFDFKARGNFAQFVHGFL